MPILSRLLHIPRIFSKLDVVFDSHPYRATFQGDGALARPNLGMPTLAAQRLSAAAPMRFSGSFPLFAIQLVLLGSIGVGQTGGILGTGSKLSKGYLGFGGDNPKQP